MTKDEKEAIIRAINGALGQALQKLTEAPEKGNGAAAMPLPQKVVGPGTEYGNVFDRQSFEDLYQKIKRRLIDECRVDPILLTLLTTANAVEVQVEPRTLTLDGSSLKGRIMRLAVGGFFKTPKTQADTNRELARVGSAAHTGRLSDAFAELKGDGFLTLEGSGFQLAPGVTITETTVTAR